jgi:hypothetical protein
MANKKITELTALTTAASDDVLAIVDVAGAETKKITVANLTGGGGSDHLSFNGGGYISTTSETAVTWGMSTGDTTYFNYLTTLVIPINCRVINVTTQSQSSGGSTDISVYKPSGYNTNVSSETALGTVNQAAHNSGVVYTSTFDTPTTYDFAAGDRLGVSVYGTTNLNGLSLTILLKTI